MTDAETISILRQQIINLMRHERDLEAEVARLQPRVPTRTIPANNYFTVEMSVPTLLFGKRYKIESQDPISFYVVDQNGLAEFQKGAAFAPYERGEKVTEFNKCLHLNKGSYWMIFQNTNPDTTAVHYEIIG